MDGHFVPNLSWGMPVIASLRTRLPTAHFDVHLMVSHPERWVHAMRESGADTFTFHLEACADDAAVRALIDDVRAHGMRVGIALSPGTPATALRPYLPLIDMALVMTVEPGFGGQPFEPQMCRKMMQLRRWAPAHLDLQVDGGISPTTAPVVAAAGANVLVAGSAVFRGAPAQAIATMRTAVLDALPVSDHSGSGHSSLVRDGQEDSGAEQQHEHARTH